MKILKSIFQFFWSLYFIIVFFGMMIFALIIFKIQYFFFKTKYETQFKDFLFRGIGKATRVLFLIKVKDIYHSAYDANQSYIIVGNHNAALDIPINTSSCPKNINLKFLGKAEAAKMPFIGVLITSLSVLVDRKSTESRQNTYKLMADEIAKGYSIFIYAEGTRNRTNEPLKEFYDGAFKLAIDHQLPLVVCTLIGTKIVNSPHRTMTFSPGRVDAHWEIPIETKGKTHEDIPALKEQVKTIMLQRLQQGFI